MGRFLSDSKKKGRNLLATSQSTQKGRNLLADNQAVVPEVMPPQKTLLKTAGEGLINAVESGIPPVGIYRHPERLPLVGQVTGGMVGGYPGSVAGAGTGKVFQNVLEGLKSRKFIDPRRGVAPEMAGTGTIEALFRGAGKLSRPLARKAANRLMLSVMKPGREVIKRNPNLGVEAVEQGIYGTKEQMIRKAQNLIKQYESQIASKLKGRPERINAQRILVQLDNLASNAKKGLKAEDAQAIEQIKNEFISKLPAKTVKESRQFVTSVGKSTRPQVTSVKGASIKRSVAEPRYDPNTGKYVTETVTPKGYIESPEDIVALHRPGIGLQPRKITSISPKVTYSVDPYASPEYSVSKEVIDPVGLNLEQAQAMKKAIYNETPQAAFNRQMSELPGKGEARRTIASALRRQIMGAAPEVKPLLRGESTAISAKNALENVMANEAKHVVIPKLAGMGAGGVAAAGHPIAGLGVLAGNAAFDALRSTPILSGTAKNLLRLKSAGRPITLAATETIRRLFGS